MNGTVRRILLTLVSVVALGALVACGDSGNHTPRTPVGGNNAGFSNASLKGNYVFSANGATSSFSYAVAGVFTADGAGNITSGLRDTVNDGGNQTLNEQIKGTYIVNQDGRGQVNLKGSSEEVIYRFVMQSAASASLFQISTNADAVGRIELQTSVPTQLSGTYIIRLDGEDLNLNPYGTIGGLTFTGTSITGTIDENDAGTFRPQLAATGSTVSPALTGRSTFTYTTAKGTHNLIAYWVSPSRVELISSDKNFFLYGDADLQTSVAGTVASFAGNEVIKTSGFTSNGPILETGRLTLDGTGNLTSAIEDYNEEGVYYDGVTFGGTYAVDATGRWNATLTYPTSTLGLVGWQVSPQQSTVLVTVSNRPNYNIVETGTMRAQTVGLTAASVTGNYAEILSGFLVGSGKAESGGNFSANGAGNLNGTVDSQTQDNVSSNVSESGTYSVTDSNGRGSGTIGTVPLRVYTVDANTLYMISTDSKRLYQGMMSKQQ